jgi:hypothetical protein
VAASRPAIIIIITQNWTIVDVKILKNNKKYKNKLILLKNDMFVEVKFHTF